MKKDILGVKVDLIGREEAIEKILQWTTVSRGKPKLVATAYSEFFVNASCDKDFRMALEGSDLITPDGIGPLGAIYFRGILKVGDPMIVRLFKGLQTGLAILTKKVGQPVSGYWMFMTLLDRAAKDGLAVFLLGGYENTAERLAEKIRLRYPEIKLDYDSGMRFDDLQSLDEKKDREVIAKINKFTPDLLFVAYGPVKQEKWLWKHKVDLNVKVAMGVGGTFDEALGLVKEAPSWMTQMGLKWLWRLLQQPQRLPRIFKATIVFAWLVFVDSYKHPEKIEAEK